ncbi:MAG: hypothetical protein P8J45_14125 [Phycisphaerales bacterium]|jgi:hypothetical protein|nr:hypothetical protein [Phycisphaerales bacterium]
MIMKNTSMHHSFLALVSVILLSISSGAGAQDVTGFIQTTNPLTTSQKQVLDTFVTEGVRGLTSETPPTVVKARDKFIEVLTSFGTSPVFREAFGSEFIKQTRPILESGNHFNRFNVLRVMAFVRTSDSNLALARRIENESMTNPAGRIFVSNMLSTSLKSTDAELVRPRQFNSIIRAIINGATQEKSWIALQHEFRALTTIGSDTNVPNDIRGAAISAQAKVLSDTLGRLKDDPKLARAISGMVLLLRTEFIGLDGLTRRDFNKKIVASLVQIIATADGAWEQLQADADIREAYGDAIYQATVLTRLVLGPSGTPKSDPSEAWRDGNRANFLGGAGDWTKLAGS